jgi:hypothetical protein
MKLKKSIFSFHFSLDEKEEFQIAAFTVDKKHPCKELEDLTTSKDFETLVRDCEEEYGVHDVSCSPETEFMGFTSYEVEKENIDKVMKIFSDFFTAKGFTVSEVMKFEVSYNEEEEESYDQCQEELDEKYNKYIDSFKV